jgi:predicted dehydrogenase
MRVFSPTAGFGPDQAEAARYLSDRASGGTLLSILGGHTLDLCEFLLGDLRSVSALTTTLFPTITVSDAPGTFTRTAADHLLVHGRFTAGVPLNAEIAGARRPGARFFLEIAGEQGRLVIMGGHPFGFQAGRLSLEHDGRVPAQDDCASARLPEAAVQLRRARHEPRMVRKPDGVRDIALIARAPLWTRVSADRRSREASAQDARRRC